MQKALAHLALAMVVCVSLVACSKQSKTISGSVIRGESARHKVTAKAGQTLDVKVTSDENNAVFQIYLPAEKSTLPGAGETDDATSWSGKVPADGEYVIVIGPTRGNASYKLTYSVK
jgi:ABC-type enterochelin transport system substrate-binding protein